jgi:predicted DNA-binding mobile mystery protein A
MTWRPPPKKGYINAIRKALYMSSAQLARRMGISQSGVSLLEKRERVSSVTLDTLDRAADALGCELHYELVPKKGSRRY